MISIHQLFDTIVNNENKNAKIAPIKNFINEWLITDTGME